MKRKILFVVLGILTLPSLAFALTYFQSTQTLVPFQDATFDLGTSTARYRNLYISGTCTGCSAGSQTPWGQAIDGAGFALTNAGRIVATYFTATSTTATSTFQQLSFTNATGTNLSVTASSSFAWPNLGSTTANSLAIPSIVSAIVLTNANGAMSAYGGSGPCGANTAVTQISALGALTCGASLFTYPFLLGATTTPLSFGNLTFTNGTGTAATTTSLFSNFFTAVTSNATVFNATGTGVANQSVFQNLTFVNATGTNATTTGALYSGQLQSLDARVTNLTATSGITYADGFKQTRGSFQFGATDVNATTTDIFTMQSFTFPVTIQSISGIIDCPNGCIAAPSGITVKFWHGTNRSASTTATALFTVNPTFTSTTTLQTFNSGFNDATLAANEILWYQIVAASTTQMSIDFSGVATTD